MRIQDALRKERQSRSPGPDPPLEALVGGEEARGGVGLPGAAGRRWPARRGGGGCQIFISGIATGTNGRTKGLPPELHNTRCELLR